LIAHDCEQDWTWFHEAGDVSSVENTEAGALPGVGYLMDSNIRGSRVSACNDSDDVTEAGK